MRRARVWPWGGGSRATPRERPPPPACLLPSLLPAGRDRPDGTAGVAGVERSLVSRHRASGKAAAMAPGRLAGAQEGSRAPPRFLIHQGHGPFLSRERGHPAPSLDCHGESEPRESLAPASPAPAPATTTLPFAPRGSAEGDSLGGAAWPWLPCCKTPVPWGKQQ